MDFTTRSSYAVRTLLRIPVLVSCDLKIYFERSRFAEDMIHEKNIVINSHILPRTATASSSSCPAWIRIIQFNLSCLTGTFAA